jgi:hypothetical protein
MPTSLKRALELATQVEDFPLGSCGPSDGPELQTAYLYAFLDLARAFVAAVKRIGDPDLSEQVSKLNLDVRYIAWALRLQAELHKVIVRIHRPALSIVLAVLAS